MSVLNNTTVNGVVTQTMPATQPSHLVRLDQVQALLAAQFQGNWNGVTTFTAGQMAKDGRSLYIANQTTQNQQPSATPTVWRLAAEGGVDGASAFLYVAFASDAGGTGFSLTPGSGLNYIAFLSTTTVINSPSASDFSGLWQKYVGADGANGSAGASAYLYTGYASDTSGTGFSLTPGSGLNYIAVLASATVISSPSASDFAGLWKKYVGSDGANGSAGAAGASAFIYTAYASDASGTGFSLTPGSGLNYVAFKATTTAIGSPSASDFTGLWKRFVGTDGANGSAGASAYLYTGYASDTSGTGFSLTPGSGLNYVAFLSTTSPIGSPSASDFAGLWKKFVGNDGSTGATGGTGAAGQSAYFYIGYASDTGGTGFSLTPGSGLNYVAFLSTTSPIASPSASDFAGLWKNYASTFAVSGAITFTSGTLGLNAASANTASYLVQRDSSGNFSAGTVSVTALTVGGSATISYASSTVNINAPLTVTALTVGSLSGVLKASSGTVAGGATSDDVTEGSTNKYFTNARVLATPLTGLTSTHVILATDTILAAFGKLDTVLGGSYPAGTVSGNFAISGNLVVSGTTTLGSLSGVLKAASGVVAGGATTDDLTEGSTNLYFTNTRADARITASRGANNGIAPLDSSGKVPLANLYAYGATTFGANSQSAMLALSSAKQGDICLRSDTNIAYVLTNNTPSILSNWAAWVYPVTSVNGASGAVTLTSDNVAVGSINLYWTQTLFNSAIAAIKGANSGICPLDSSGLVPSANLPPLGNSTWTVNSQSAQTNLTSALKGDIALRTDQNLTYVLSNNTPTSFGSWLPILYPVNSVNGSTGTVVLTTSNITEGSNLYFTNARAIAATLTGYTSGAGTISSSDTVLSAIQKLNGNIAALGAASTTGATFSGVVNFSGSANNGLRVNNLTAAQITALTGTNGTIVYQTDGTQAIKAFVNGGWITLGSNNNLPLAAGSGSPLTGALYFQDGLANFVQLGNAFNIRVSNSNGNLDFQQGGTTVLTCDSSNNVTIPNGVLKIGTHQVVGAQATLSLSGGSTAASGWTDSGAMSDFNDLINRLRTHGLFA